MKEFLKKELYSFRAVAAILAHTVCCLAELLCLACVAQLIVKEHSVSQSAHIHFYTVSVYLTCKFELA